MGPRDAGRACKSFKRKGPTLSRAITVISLFALLVDLGGCALVPDAVSDSMADPARYEFFDCKQLEATRKSLASQAAELEGLIAKAETGVGGSVVAEVAYRPDLAKVRASAHLADKVWERDRCTATAQPSPPAATSPSLSPETKQRPPEQAGRSYPRN
jgi:hypothetical protein